MARTFDTFAELAALAGQELAVSDWATIGQQRIDQFALATGDWQWIHVDPQRAAAGPFGTTIAHGFLTLSLLSQFYDETIRVRAASMGVNYGLNRVRFLAPVPVDSRIRARFRLLSADPLEAGALQCAWSVALEREGSTRPVCVAETLVRLYP